MLVRLPTSAQAGMGNGVGVDVGNGVAVGLGVAVGTVVVDGAKVGNGFSVAGAAKVGTPGAAMALALVVAIGSGVFALATGWAGVRQFAASNTDPATTTAAATSPHLTSRR